MGQTLTHGIYLPDEGERNCYNGLAANWQILDNSVGTIAEHSTQIAGKAPLVHTHTKSDITDFPVYGNTAGTICEGNDSRLSDARTPVAHTHGKADITDLFNSANTWSQINDFKTLRLYGVASNNLVMYPPSGEKGDSSTFGFNIICSDKNLGTYANSGVANIGMGQSGGTSYVALNASTKGSTDNNIHSIQIGLQIAAADNANTGSFYPTQNNGINLGNSSNQWNNLYAKNYYYNGTAWGLDKSNTWSGSNTFTNGFTLKNTSWSGKVPPSSRKIVEIPLSNSDTVQSRVMSRVDASSTETWITTIRNIDANTSYESTLIHTVDNNGNRKLQPLYGDVALGAPDSGSRFKTLNGVNPGALSLPSEDASSVNLDPTNWNTTGSNFNSYIPPSDGWLGVQVKSADVTDLTGQYVFAGRSTGGDDYWAQGSIGVLKMLDNPRLVGQVFIPVKSGKTYFIRIKINKTQTEGSIILARFYPCEGNV